MILFKLQSCSWEWPDELAAQYNRLSEILCGSYHGHDWSGGVRALFWACTICNKMALYNDLSTECAEKCRFWVLEAMMDTLSHCIARWKMNWIYSETKARGWELSLLNRKSFLDEKTWHFFDTFVHTHSNHFHRCSSTCRTANWPRITTAEVRSHQSLAESIYCNVLPSQLVESTDSMIQTTFL